MTKMKMILLLAIVLFTIIGGTGVSAVDCPAKEEISSIIDVFYDSDKHDLNAFEIIDLIRHYYECDVEVI